MKLFTRIFIVLAVLAVVGAGGYFGYNAAYAMGETTGYENGYSVGHETGYTSGEQDGYDKGEQEGYDKGYTSGEQDGYDKGEQEGYDKGYTSGKADGYQTGYDQGMEAGFGHGYTLRDPTYAEAVAFIKADKTDENEYVKGGYGIYVCSHFARDVGNSATEAGLRCAFVELRYPDSGHAIIAFATIDEGLVYFDPITDDRTKPVIGKRYYQCMMPEAGFYYSKPSFDDTIMDILVIW